MGRGSRLHKLQRHIRPRKNNGHDEGGRDQRVGKSTHELEGKYMLCSGHESFSQSGYGSETSSATSWLCDLRYVT